MSDTWMTVDSLSPLMVRESQSMPALPVRSSCIAVTSLTVGDRVRCQGADGQVTIIGVRDMVPMDASHLALFSWDDTTPTITPASGTSSVSDVSASRRLGVCSINVTLVVNSSVAVGQVMRQLCTLPVGFRPRLHHTFPLNAGSIQINKDTGMVTMIYNQMALNAGAGVYIYISYPHA